MTPSVSSPVEPTRERAGDWIQTFGGNAFWPLDPESSEINLVEIAAALAKQCRYAGHCLRFYSVAEHSVLMYRFAKRHGVSVDAQRAALLHDASEAYLVDIPSPVKPFLAGYREIEHRLMAMIAERYAFEWPLPTYVHMLDVAICADEKAQNMAPSARPWGNLEGVKPLGVQLQFWLPDQAFSEFIDAAAECGCFR